MLLPGSLEGPQNTTDAERGERIAVLSDIHSNWHALQAVFAHCAEHGVKRFLCLGDIVGYGAFPRECLDAIRDLHCPTVLGNHDESVARGGANGDLNPMARAGVEYSVRKLDAQRRAWLRERPMIITSGVVTIVHASLEDPKEWVYILDALSAQPCLALQETPVCFHGHTHRPAIYCREDRPVATRINEFEFRVPMEGRTLINAGSVGQPRDGNPRAQFVIFNPDPAGMSVELVRVPYDVTAAANAILEAGLPSTLATRLLQGR